MDLEATMASLQLNDTNKNNEQSKSEEAPKEIRRSSRLKHRISYTEKRRVYTKPMKVSKDNENYYLNKRSKIPSPDLETIYEEKSEEKVIKRQKMKVRSVSAKQRVNNKKKVSLKLLLDKLAELDE